MTDYSRSSILLPHFEEAEAFLNALDGKDAQFTFQTFDDVKDRKEKSLARIFHGTLNQHKQVLKALNAQGAGVYVTVNETDLKGRSLANMLKVRALFVDLDGSPLQPILDLSEDLQPHIIIESSPNKWHAYWLVNNCELEKFKPLQQALADKFDGDKAVCDLPRVMRLAGFSHNKAESFITRIHTMQDTLAPYSVNKLMFGLGLKNDKKAKSQAAIVAISAIDDDFTIGLPPEADVIADLKSALEYLSCEPYHDWVRQAMHLKTLGNAGLELWLTWSSTSAKYNRAEAIDKWHSLQADRTGYKAIFNEAKANGWTNPLSSHKPPKTEKTDPIDPDLINKTIEALPTPEERNTARALQDALTYIEPQDAIGESLSTGEKVIGYGLSHEYKQAQGNIGALLAIDWDNKTGGDSFYYYQKADLKLYDPIKVASIYRLAQSKGWVMPPEEWQEPDPIINEQESADYPLEHLPESLRLLVVEIVNYLQCPVAMAANSVLAALSLSTQGLVNVSRDNRLIGAVSLFLMVIAESGERKSACDNLVLDKIKQLNTERFCNDAAIIKDYQLTQLQIWTAKRQGLMSALQQNTKTGESTEELERNIKEHDKDEPPRPRGTTFLYEDATIEALTKGLYFNSPSGGIFSSEAGVVFGSHGMSKDNATRTMGNINKLWDGDSIIIDRSDISKNMLLTGRRLTLCLATQESTVRAFFDGTNGLARGTGFGARFLIAWPKSTQGTRLYKAPPSHWPHLTHFSNHVINLLNTDLSIDDATGALRPITLHLSQQAHAAWIKFFNDTEQELGIGGELTDIKDVTSKAADNVARIAALFHVYEHGITGTISEAHILNAGHIMAWYLIESKRFFSEVSLSKELRHTTMLDNWLLNYCKEHQTHEISTRTLKQLCPNSLRNKASFDDAISHLIDLNRVKIVNQGKKKLIHLNPKLLEV